MNVNECNCNTFIKSCFTERPKHKDGERSSFILEEDTKRFLLMFDKNMV